MVADQVAGAPAHGVGVERRRDMPDPAAVQSGRRPAVQDSIDIDPAYCRQARVEIVGRPPLPQVR